MSGSDKKKKMRRRQYPRGAYGVRKDICLLRKSTHMQRWFMRNPWMKPMLCFNLAVIKMQVRVRVRVRVRVHACTGWYGVLSLSLAWSLAWSCGVVSCGVVSCGVVSCGVVSCRVVLCHCHGHVVMWCCVV
jgi:hypothetical protein